MEEKAYRVSGWKTRYEVDDKGRTPTGPADKLRRGSLPFVRLRVYGLKTGPAYRRMMSKAEPLGLGMGLATFGLFCKLLEIAADQRSDYRGWILDEKQNPMTAEDLAEVLSIDPDVVRRGLEVLTDPKIGWVDQAIYTPFPDFPGNDGGNPGNDGGSLESVPGSPGGTSEQPRDHAGGLPNSPAQRNETKHNTTQHNETEPPRENPGGLATPSVKISGGAFVSLRGQGASRLVQDLEAISALEEIFPQRTDSDDTTIGDIVRQADPGQFATIIQAAANSTNAENPIARWVDWCKRNSGYIPKGKNSPGCPRIGNRRPGHTTAGAMA